MQRNQLTENVRQLICQEFTDLETGKIASFRESILIRDGYYCGRRFECAQRYAIWFIEEHQVKFYGPDGAVEHVLSLNEAGSPRQSKAA